MSESLPGTPPSRPNSSPATRTSLGPTPWAQRSANAQRAASALSVSPISTYFASLPIRAALSPDSAAAACASVTTSAIDPIPAARRRPSTACSRSTIRALGGSAHSSSGMMSTFRRFSRCATIAASKPRAFSCSTVRAAVRSSCESSSDVAVRRTSSVGPARPHSNTSEPRLTQKRSRPGPDGRAFSCLSTLSTCVPVMTMTSKPVAHNASISRRTRVASAERSGTNVPSQSAMQVSKRRSRVTRLLASRQ